MDTEELKYVYPGDSWKRLQSLKAKHDPTGMFKATKIPPAAGAIESKVAGVSLATETAATEMSQ